ncbi:unnamed protein product [Linum trigynum]|uniref:RNase H type-1 domain-containing protein n=1 Tax=Linum trigynum TaxID=586398 RepID=A0AAV2F3A8_9ROSI
MVVRGPNGQFLMAASKRIPGRWSVEEAETIAAEFGVQLAKQHHLMNPILETDSLGLVTKLHEAELIESETGIRCRSIRRILEDLGLNSWQHVRREGNAAAHRMAQAETRWNEQIVWFDNRPPPFLVNQLTLDAVTAYIG